MDSYEFVEKYVSEISGVLVPKGEEMPEFLSGIPAGDYETISDCFIKLLEAEGNYLVVVNDEESFNKLKSFSNLINKNHFVVYFNDEVYLLDFEEEIRLRELSFFDENGTAYQAYTELADGIFKTEKDIVVESADDFGEDSVPLKRYNDNETRYRLIKNADVLGSFEDVVPSMLIGERFKLVTKIAERKSVCGSTDFGRLFIITTGGDAYVYVHEKRSGLLQPFMEDNFARVIYAVVLGLDHALDSNPDAALKEVFEALKKSCGDYPAYIYEDLDRMYISGEAPKYELLASSIQRMTVA